MAIAADRRKIIVDTYGGAARMGAALLGQGSDQGGPLGRLCGALSGQERRRGGWPTAAPSSSPTPSASPSRCRSTSILHGTGKVDEAKIEKALSEVMDLTPRGIRKHLDSTSRSMRAPRPTAISAASPMRTAASPGRRPTSPTRSRRPSGLTLDAETPERERRVCELRSFGRRRGQEAQRTSGAASARGASASALSLARGSPPRVRRDAFCTADRRRGSRSASAAASTSCGRRARIQTSASSAASHSRTVSSRRCRPSTKPSLPNVRS